MEHAAVEPSVSLQSSWHANSRGAKITGLQATIRMHRHMRRRLRVREWAATFGLTRTRLALTTLYLSLSLDAMASTMQLAVLPFYILSLGGTHHDVGLCLAVFAAFQGPSASIMTTLSDHLGRKSMLLLAYSGSVVGHLMSAIATDMTTLIVARAVLGAFASSDMIATAMLHDLVSESELPKYLSLLTMTFCVCVMTGPVLGSAFTGGGASALEPENGLMEGTQGCDMVSSWHPTVRSVRHGHRERHVLDLNADLSGRTRDGVHLSALGGQPGRAGPPREAGQAPQERRTPEIGSAARVGSAGAEAHGG